MKLTQDFTVECCGDEQRFGWQYEALEWLLKHIERNHPQTLKVLAKAGRELAKSQNGKGYYDNGSAKSTTWRDAGHAFRRAWVTHALEERLKKGTPEKE